MAEKTADTTYIRILDPQLEAASRVSSALSGLFNAPGQQLPLFPETDDCATQNDVATNVPPVVAHFQAHIASPSRRRIRPRPANGWPRTGPIVTCVECGKEFRAWSSYSPKRNHGKNYCSRECRYAVQVREFHHVEGDEVTRTHAYNMVYLRIRSGVLAKPDKCQKCGQGGRIVAHHRDYSKALSVDWLCTRCHMAEHAKN